MRLVLNFCLLISIALPSAGMRPNYIAIEDEQGSSLAEEQPRLVECIAKPFFDNQLSLANIKLVETRVCFEDAFRNKPDLLASSIELLKENYSYQKFIDNWLNSERLAEY